MGYGMRHDPRSGRLHHARLDLDSIPKDIGNTSSYKCLASLLNPGGCVRKDPDGSVGFVDHRRTPGMQGRLLIFKGTLGPFDLHARLSKDQAGSISNLIKCLRR